MNISKEVAFAHLTAAGFQLASSSGFGDSYEKVLDGRWKITAFGGFVGNAFLGNTNRDMYDEISMSLDGKGTTHVFLSGPALVRDLAATVDALSALSLTPDLLKCPKCGTRFVHTKFPTPGGKQFRPFLSCDGMMIEGRGKGRGPLCTGTSNRIPALETHR
ncbi:hypothetical protein [Paraburkholderia sp. A3RO-2L]|uniref:hypothetical protein n=1 Tax=Paraburkholderia sp. A3RO-2L TaxID=3028376 RepID=UPI003DA8D47F